jgi:hypothetical protein
MKLHANVVDKLVRPPGKSDESLFGIRGPDKGFTLWHHAAS